MKLVVLLEVGADLRIPPERDPRSGRVRQEWLVRELDAASRQALHVALRLKKVQPETEITVIHLGGVEDESWLRHALAQGSDRAVRVWDGEMSGVSAAGKAVVLTAAAQAAGYDLILTGARGAIDGAGQLGVLLGERLGVPCVTQVVDIHLSDRPNDGMAKGVMRMERELDRGFKELVETLLPAVVTVSENGSGGPASCVLDISAAALLAAEAQELLVWNLSDLGVTVEEIRRADRSLRYGSPRPRHPKLRHIPAPNPELPAFDRILKLIEGSLQRREGRVVREPAEVLVEEIFQTLKNEGWLDYLRSGDDSCEERSTGGRE